MPFDLKPRPQSELALPLYHQVAGILRQQVRDGVYVAGGRLPSEEALTTEFAVSRATIRQAVGELVRQGLVERSQGRGTFVTEPRGSANQQRFRGSLADLINESHRASLLEFSIKHDATLPDYAARALQLALPIGVTVSRLRSLGDNPFSYTRSYLPPSVGAHLTDEALRESRSLLMILLSNGVEVARASQSVKAQLADPELSRQMSVDLGAALLHVERTVYDAMDQPVEYVRSWYRGDLYEYTVDLTVEADSAPNVFRQWA